jgi:Rrf2 family protein
MKLSRSSMYAVKALLELGSAPPGVKVTCHQLAENGHMPERFLLQILRNLVTSGLLKSTRGVHGGYRLGRPSHQISIESARSQRGAVSNSRRREDCPLAWHAGRDAECCASHASHALHRRRLWWRLSWR